VRPPKYRHVGAAISLAPTFLRMHLACRTLLWKEMKRITYLSTLQRLLTDASLSRGGSVVLDEGAVYMLARLRVMGQERVDGVAFEGWRGRALEEWSRILDLVVWLDAPDAVLIHRLRTRSQAHPMKAMSDEAIGSFLSAYREAYASVITELRASGRPAILSIRTDQQPVDQVADRVAGAMRR
jgi:hypothetical protein